MSHFLIIFDKPAGRILEIQEFEEHQHEQALQALFDREMVEREHPHIEVVLLGAPSLEVLKQTHSRYFMSVEEMLTSLGRMVDEGIARLKAV